MNSDKTETLTEEKIEYERMKKKAVSLRFVPSFTQT